MGSSGTYMLYPWPCRFQSNFGVVAAKIAELFLIIFSMILKKKKKKKKKSKSLFDILKI